MKFLMMKPKYPIYIVSKGRWETRLTSASLHEMNMPHFIVVEQSEYDNYARVKDSTATLLILDQKYKNNYEVCDEFGLSKSTGPGPARNFAWDHAIAAGYAWHWVMDDNINGFYRLNRNLKIKAQTATIFRCMEDFCSRYERVAMAGPNYTFFAKRKQHIPPFITNTRIYSCNLIRNDVPYRWRGRYNEDTDLSLRMLKDEFRTIQFNAFLQQKLRTQTLAGGNTAEFYAKVGTKPKSDMQVQLHPDVSTLVWKFGRWHHHVDYTGFKRHKLILKNDAEITPQVNDYGMILQINKDKNEN
jgi:hypothetical protein